MENDFDHIATIYDVDFTHSEIGKCQRNSVYTYLENFFLKQQKSSLNLLEINGGTGEDAIWLSKKARSIVSTDISSKMVEVSAKKSKGIDNIQFQQLNIKELDKWDNKNQHFDLIFSNFGGLNCLNRDELKLFFKSANKLLTKRGKLILIIMPKNCLWEKGYFFLKKKFKLMNRRNTNHALPVNVENKNIDTWYFNPNEIQELAGLSYKVIAKKPIGFFIPPSYLENYFKRHKLFLSILDKLERSISKMNFLARFSDHYLIELESDK